MLIFKGMFGKSSKNKRIYFDYAASTPVREEVLQVMRPYWSEEFGNPLATHSFGREAQKKVSEATQEVALGLFARPDEIYFTSGGTESNALALRGTIDEMSAGSSVVISSIEHSSVLGIEEYAKKRGVEMRKLPVSSRGIIDISKLSEVIDSSTRLISIGLVNSEIGTIQPIRHVVQYAKKHAPALIHTDASQAPLWITLNVTSLGIDMLTLDAQKMYGPKGIGILYIRRGVNLSPLFFSTDERVVRPGTPPVPLIMGFSKAFSLAQEGVDERVSNVEEVRNYFIDNLQERGGRLNGALTERVANNVNITFPHINHLFLQTQLDEAGIACALGSACQSGEEEGSYVIRSIGGDGQALRFTLGEETTRKDIDCALEEIDKALKVQKA